MSLSLGIVGIPNSGKSTLFNALSKGDARVSNHPFTTIEPNIGSIKIADERLLQLQPLYVAKRCVPAEITFFDIAGLIEGSSKGEGMGNKFLSHIRQTDALVIVLRCFEDPQVQSYGNISPAGDMEILTLELLLADLDVVEHALEKREHAYKLGEKAYKDEVEALQKVVHALRQGHPASMAELSSKEKDLIKAFSLLTAKPVLYVANLDEKHTRDEQNRFLDEIKKNIPFKNAEVMTLCAKIEQELSELPDEEATLFAAELGMERRALDALLDKCRKLLSLITFFTGNEKEVRAWTIPEGLSVQKAAGKIHSDMERGFIKAEVIPCDELIRIGSISGAREKGSLRVEGRDYIVREGDVIYIRFNV